MLPESPLKLVTRSPWKGEAWVGGLSGGSIEPGVLMLNQRLEEPDEACSASVGKKWRDFTTALKIAEGEWIAVADILAIEPDGEVCTTDRDDIGEAKIIQFANKMQQFYRKPLLVQNALAVGRVGGEGDLFVSWRTALFSLSPSLLKLLADPHDLEMFIGEYPSVYKPRSLGAIHFPALIEAAQSKAQDDPNVWMKFKTVKNVYTVKQSGMSPGMDVVLDTYMCGFPQIENGNIRGLVPYNRSMSIL